MVDRFAMPAKRRTLGLLSSLIVPPLSLLLVASQFATPAFAGDAPPKAVAAKPAAPAVAAKPAAPAPVPAGKAIPKTAPPVAPVDPAITSLERFGQGIERLTLENGLRLVLASDNSAKTVAVSVTYGVGSRDEGPGQSGFAHLFEHMMFQGSEHVAKGKHFTFITERGGQLNGTTSSDRTNYFEVLPSTELPLALWLEADRMRALAVNAENFENQRAVVKEEYRMSYENTAYRTGMLRLGELVFADYPPYAHPTIGSMKDLDGAKLEWVKTFYDTHYAPKNAVLTIAGDFDRDEAVKLARQYFGSIDKPVQVRAPLPPAPETVTPRKDVVKDTNAKTPGFFFGYLIPKSRTPEHYALEVATALLGDGDSSRLERLLVRERAVAQQVSAGTYDNVGPDMLLISAVLTENAKLPMVEKLVEDELLKLAKTPPPAAELDKVKRRIRSSFVFGLQTNLSRATKLGEYESYFGDARLLARELQQYQAVTAEDVQKAVKKYLGAERRNVVEVVPVEAPPPAAAPAAAKAAAAAAPAAAKPAPVTPVAPKGGKP
ncbi:MAG TPA: pitrilysin family protein [Polyangiaceae bacterium]|nr:pitrilysin family protein [Polyangiaceae bacterium]